MRLPFKQPSQKTREEHEAMLADIERRHREKSDLTVPTAIEADNARLRAELAKALAVVEPLERLLAWKPGYPVMIRKLSYSHRVDIGPCEFEAYKLGETLLLAATNVK